MKKFVVSLFLGFGILFASSSSANALALVDVANPTPPPDFFQFEVFVLDDADRTVVIHPKEPLVPLLPGFELRGFVDLDYFDTNNVLVQRGRFRIWPGFSDDGNGKLLTPLILPNKVVIFPNQRLMANNPNNVLTVAPVPVPAPLPILGIIAALSYSRRLRKLAKDLHNSSRL
jgi:hypothetical protein